MEGVPDQVSPDAFLCALSRFVPLEQAWSWQQQWQHLLIRNQISIRQPNVRPWPELLLLLEHPPCYTLGRGASAEFLGFDPAKPPEPLWRLDLPVAGLQQWLPGCTVGQLQQPLARALARRLGWERLAAINEQNLINLSEQDEPGLGSLER
jgi:hypothetical protein